MTLWKTPWIAPQTLIYIGLQHDAEKLSCVENSFLMQLKVVINKDGLHKKRSSILFYEVNLCLRFIQNKLFYGHVNDPVHNPRDILANP
jgi:hypothetical protein